MLACSPTILVPRSWILNSPNEYVVRDDPHTGDISHRHTPTGDISMISIPRRRGRTPPSELFPSLHKPDSWPRTYSREPFMCTSFHGSNRRASDTPATQVRSTFIDANDGRTFQNHCICFGEDIFFKSVLQYANRYSYRLDVSRLVLGKHIHGIFFMTHDCGVQTLTAASGWARCWFHIGRKKAA